MTFRIEPAGSRVYSPRISSEKGALCDDGPAYSTFARTRTTSRASSCAVALAFDIDDNLVNVLGRCKKAVEVSIPTRMDDESCRFSPATA